MMNQFQEDMQIAFIQERKKRAKFLAQQMATQQFGPDPSANKGQTGGGSSPSPMPMQSMMGSNQPGMGVAQRLSAPRPPNQFNGSMGMHDDSGGMY